MSGAGRDQAPWRFAWWPPPDKGSVPPVVLDLVLDLDLLLDSSLLAVRDQPKIEDEIEIEIEDERPRAADQPRDALRTPERPPRRAEATSCDPAGQAPKMVL